MNLEEFEKLASGHALHALSADDERRFEQALLAHPEWRDRVEADAATAAALAETLAPVTPPPDIRDQLLMAIGGTSASASEPGHDAAAPRRSTDPAPAEHTPPPSAGPGERRHRWRRTLFALAASVVLLAGIGIGAAIVVPQLLRPVAVSALEDIRAAEDAEQASVDLPTGGAATLHWSEDTGSVVLVTTGLADLDEQQTYELWFVRADAPVAAGTFLPEGGDATALLDGRMQRGDVIAVTVEPVGGSPDGTPSTDPIIVIPTA